MEETQAELLLDIEDVHLSITRCIGRTIKVEMDEERNTWIRFSDDPSLIGQSACTLCLRPVAVKLLLAKIKEALQEEVSGV